MAGRLLRKLLGRPGPAPEIAPGLAELERMAGERPALRTHAALLADLLPILFVANADASLVTSRERVAEKLAGGLPVLRGETLTLPERELSKCWQKVCAGLARHQRHEQAPALSEAVARGRLSLRELVSSILAGSAQVVHAQAAALGLDAGLTATVLRLVLFPTLSRLAGRLPIGSSLTAWGHGYCPVCGSWPLLGEFRGLEQVRMLRCGWCASEWPYPRLQCPFCELQDHRLLGFLHVEQEEARYRLATCDGCRGYVKMISTHLALSPPQLLVADLATLHLDLAAAERGYCPET